MMIAKKNKSKTTDPLGQKPQNVDRKKVNKLESKLYDMEKEVINSMGHIFDYKKNQDLLNRIQ